MADILSHHVVLTLEGIDRRYLNAYVPQLQHDQGVLRFFRQHRGNQVASSVLMAPMSRVSSEPLKRSAPGSGYRC